MPNYNSRFTPETMRTIAGASLTNAYQTIGSALAFPSRMLIFENNTGVLIYLSWDGVNDHLAIIPGGAIVLDETSNAVASGVLETNAQTQFWARQPQNTAGTDNLYLSNFYAG